MEGDDAIVFDGRARWRNWEGLWKEAIDKAWRIASKFERLLIEEVVES